MSLGSDFDRREVSVREQFAKAIGKFPEKPPGEMIG
jgi:hypothetical protein